MSFFENTRKPVGLGGKIMVAMMNFGHSAMAEWGLRFLQPAPDAMVLDCGAFETVYFWPELAQNFREVYRVLKPGGTFFICNEANGETAKDDKWTQIINGMTIYTDADLKVYLEQAGFGRVQSHKNKKGWLCVTAQK